LLREWVDDSQAGAGDLEKLAVADETAWRAERTSVLLYQP